MNEGNNNENNLSLIERYKKTLSDSYKQIAIIFWIMILFFFIFLKWWLLTDNIFFNSNNNALYLGIANQNEIKNKNKIETLLISKYKLFNDNLLKITKDEWNYFCVDNASTLKYMAGFTLPNTKNNNINDLGLYVNNSNNIILKTMFYNFAYCWNIGNNIAWTNIYKVNYGKSISDTYINTDVLSYKVMNVDSEKKYVIKLYNLYKNTDDNLKNKFKKKYEEIFWHGIEKDEKEVNTGALDDNIFLTSYPVKAYWYKNELTYSSIWYDNNSDLKWFPFGVLKDLDVFPIKWLVLYTFDSILYSVPIVAWVVNNFLSFCLMVFFIILIFLTLSMLPINIVYFFLKLKVDMFFENLNNILFLLIKTTLSVIIILGILSWFLHILLFII